MRAKIAGLTPGKPASIFGTFPSGKQEGFTAPTERPDFVV
jgi:hypothetical protein